MAAPPPIIAIKSYRARPGKGAKLIERSRATVSLNGLLILAWPYKAGIYQAYSCTELFIKRMRLVQGGLQIDLDLGQKWFCPTPYRTYFDFRPKTNANTLYRFGSNGSTVVVKGTSGGISATGIDITNTAIRNGEVEIIAPDRKTKATIGAGQMAISSSAGIRVVDAPLPTARLVYQGNFRIETHPTNRVLIDGVERRSSGTLPRKVRVESLAGRVWIYCVRQISKTYILELVRCGELQEQ